MKRIGKTTEETTRSIVQNKFVNVPVSITHILPKRTTLARDVAFLTIPNNKIEKIKI